MTALTTREQQEIDHANVETTLPLSQARQAYEQGSRGHMHGRVVLQMVE